MQSRKGAAGGGTVRIPGFPVRTLAIAFSLLALFTAGNAVAQDSSKEPEAAPKTESDGRVGVRTIRHIRFAGNKRRSDEFLKQQISTKEGGAFDPGLLRLDEKYLLNYFTVVLEVERIEAVLL